MRRLLPMTFLILVWPIAALAQNHPECVQVRAVARWGADAYNHFVTIDNGCERAVRCSVRTNANPDAQEVHVAPGGHAELITFRGSPAREFTPLVDCTYE